MIVAVIILIPPPLMNTQRRRSLQCIWPPYRRIGCMLRMHYAHPRSTFQSLLQCGQSILMAVHALSSVAVYEPTAVQNCVCNGNQPGHHAAFDQYGGYCFVNWAALAAQLLLRQSSSSPGRVAILDLDLHHVMGRKTFSMSDATS